MKFGFVLPSSGRTAADFARQAGLAGWDGFFVWEPVWGIDAWVALTRSCHEELSASAWVHALAYLCDAPLEACQ
jgi:hypothetical protein